MNNSPQKKALQKNKEVEPDYSCLLGNWHNLNDATQGLKQFSVFHDDQCYKLHVTGVAEGEETDWGETTAFLYIDKGPGVDKNMGKAAGFHAEFKRNGEKIFIAANSGKGIYIVQAYTTNLNTGHGYFSKEYFSGDASWGQQ